MDAFIPEIWSQEILYRLENAQHAHAFTNRNWEGEIRQGGDVVHIGTPNKVEIGKYSKNTDMASQTITATNTDLVCSESDYFNVQVDRLDQLVANRDLLPVGVDDGVIGLAQAQDAYIFSMANSVLPGNVVGSTTITPDNIYDYFTEASAILDDANLPDEGRAAALTPLELMMIRRSKDFKEAGTREGALSGFVGTYGGFNIYRSGNLVKDAEGDPGINSGDPLYNHCVFGHPMIYTFAMRVTEIEIYKPEKRFGSGAKALAVYGGKLTRPAGLAVLKSQYGVAA